MDELITYILKRIEEGAAVEDLASELRIVQIMLHHIPSYSVSSALTELAGGAADAE